ncbi:beta-barrel assembly-enhancing protease [mine drainage metagenome]|uniref:Beta-barrel assembly-enhancing protease n=1 Tax=mine drainage metagenome TaxID=410659 RepID=A0A1J5RZ07_9ZZZZ
MNAGAEAWLAQGNAAAAAGRWEEALAAYGRALACLPGWVPALINAGGALKELGRLDEAARVLGAVRAACPDDPDLLANLAGVRRQQGDFAQALALYRQVAAQAPSAAAWSNLAVLQDETGEADAAAASFAQALALAPEDAEIRFNHANFLLRSGAYRDGWQAYEARWQARAQVLRPRGFAAPAWDGTPLAGRTLLLHAEQGLGDTLQFVRFLPRLPGDGRIVLLAQTPLLDLLAASPAAAAVEVAGDAAMLPPCDCQAPLLSLPRLLGLDQAGDLGMIAPYLAPPPAFSWPRPEGCGPRIGFSWRGNARHRGNQARGLPLEGLLALLGGRGARLVSLQAGPGAAESALLAAQGVEDAGAAFTSFGHSAALVAELDLVITLDSALAHLAGGLGRPAWVCLPFAADWRWGRAEAAGPSSSLWYPSLRLYRQTAPGAWAELLAGVAADLSNLLNCGGNLTNGPGAIRQISTTSGFCGA